MFFIRNPARIINAETYPVVEAAVAIVLKIIMIYLCIAFDETHRRLF